MTSTERRLGDYIELCDTRNSDLQYGMDKVRGVNNLKLLMPTKADLVGRDLSKFQIVYPDEFVFNHRTSRNGSKFSIAYNDTGTSVICTEDYVVFRIKEGCKALLDSRWLYMFFNRPEFDRYVITNSWGSSTEFYNWEDICEVVIPIPPIEVQQKYVAIYNAMLANQRSYERGLEDLKLVCDSYVDQLRNSLKHIRLGEFIEISEGRNEQLEYGLADVRGVSIEKKFIPTKADMEGVSLKPYYLVRPDYFAYVTVTSRNGEKISLAHNGSECTYICSSSYVVFRVKDQTKLLPGYLSLLLNRSEFNRYARFNSWGSARETFDWDEMCDVHIPIPSIKTQEYITNIFIVYQLRKEINEQLKAQIRDICPILIKGSMEEGGRI